MNLGWATDIHLDHVTKSEDFERFGRELSEGNDVAVITGDIGAAGNFDGLLEELHSISKIPLYFVLGNHDFYGADINHSRTAARALTSKGLVKYLPKTGPVELSPGVWMVGVDGWADAQEGDYSRSNVRLNDSVFIKDMRVQRLVSKKHQGQFMKKMGNAEADSLRQQLDQVIGRPGLKHIVVATHVPPYREATWHEGNVSSNDFLPFFCCRATGNAISDFACESPQIKFTVLCGHTHGSGEYSPFPNVLVRTGGSEYGHPLVQNRVSF